MSEKLSQAEVREKLTYYLSLLDVKETWDVAFYNALSRVIVRVGIEAVALRGTRDHISVYLTERKPWESYAGLWHCPGTIIRPGERIKDLIPRLSAEFGCRVSALHQVCATNEPDEDTGHAVCLIHVCELDGEPLNGKWFKVNNLPKNIVDHHRDSLIPCALGWHRSRS